jgi:hypothetical protein
MARNRLRGTLGAVALAWGGVVAPHGVAHAQKPSIREQGAGYGQTTPPQARYVRRYDPDTRRWYIERDDTHTKP